MERLIEIEDLTELILKKLYIIPYSLLAELAEPSQILAHQSRPYTGPFPEFMGRYTRLFTLYLF
jgi:hypothetical protein